MKYDSKPHNNLSQPALMSSRRLSVAPMLDWTDRHYRYMARQISHHAWLYTEMIHAEAINHGDVGRLLSFSESEQPVALQLGGSQPSALAQAARTAAAFGYHEINLNCGCPSPRVQQGLFGACLMNQVGLVADCLNAMQDAVPLPVSIKHRIGIDRQTEYQPLADFVGTLRHLTACRIFIVHARNAWLAGLSPKENRDIPPLKYDYVYRLKQEFPELQIIINGGITTNAQIAAHLQHVDGVMVGREAYHNPMVMRDWDRLFYDDDHVPITSAELVAALYDYARQQLADNPSTTLRHLTRHYLGLMRGMDGARQWRRLLSDARWLNTGDAALIQTAWHAVATANADCGTRQDNKIL